jgi:hypothetical protein
MPRDNLLISINYIPAAETGRLILLKPRGEHYCELVEQLRKREGISALHAKC